MESPFKRAWWSFDLGEYRRCSGTYQIYPYESLPPLDESRFTGEFTWLAPSPRKTRPASDMTALATAAAQAAIHLPPALVRFMSDPALRAAVPSCTACEWHASATPIPCRVVPGAFTVRFLRDQQDCLFWYLHLLPDGDAHVLCSPIPFDSPSLKITREQILANTWWVAPHLEHFIYRFWLENELWYRLNSSTDKSMSPAQQAYVDHYIGAASARRAASAPAPASTPTPAATSTPVAAKASAKQASTKKASAKKVKTLAKKTPAKKTPAKKATAKAGAKKASAKKASAKKASAKKAGAKKAGAKKASAKKATAKKAGARSGVAR